MQGAVTNSATTHPVLHGYGHHAQVQAQSKSACAWWEIVVRARSCIILYSMKAPHKTHLHGQHNTSVRTPVHTHLVKVVHAQALAHTPELAHHLGSVLH